MPNDAYAQKLAEVEQLLNDPEVPLDPALVWSLLADILRLSRSQTMDGTAQACGDAPDIIRGSSSPERLEHFLHLGNE